MKKKVKYLELLKKKVQYIFHPFAFLIHVYHYTEISSSLGSNLLMKGRKMDLMKTAFWV